MPKMDFLCFNSMIKMILLVIIKIRNPKAKLNNKKKWKKITSIKSFFYITGLHELYNLWFKIESGQWLHPKINNDAS